MTGTPKETPAARELMRQGANAANMKRLEALLPEIEKESAIMAQVRSLQVKAYENAGFTNDQAFELVVLAIGSAVQK